MSFFTIRPEIRGTIYMAIAVTVHLAFCPFTKVEESFNIQAIHDVYKYGFNIAEYDHNEFPGVVPRSFIGSIIIGLILKPFRLLPFVDGLFLQMMARLILGFFVLAGFKRFASSIKRVLGSQVSELLCLVTATQFHFCFYATRTLPNTFGLVLILFAMSFWIDSNYRISGFLAFGLSAFSVFRFDLALFLVPHTIPLAYEMYREYGISGLLVVAFIGLFALAPSIGLSVLIDSFMWQRTLWPEGCGFYFNAILNQSHKWGTEPFLWYFYSALPRLLLAGTPLVASAFDRRSRQIAIPSTIFVVLFSFLPHKELRFIIYAVPSFNTLIAIKLSSWYKTHLKSRNSLAKYALPCLVVISNLFLTLMFAMASHHNYPGGAALMKLKDYAPGRVYVGNRAAQTGVTRFLEDHMGKGCWHFNKTEQITGQELLNAGFDYLLVDKDSLNHTNYRLAFVASEFDGFKRSLSEIWRTKTLVKTWESVGVYAKIK